MKANTESGGGSPRRLGGRALMAVSAGALTLAGVGLVGSATTAAAANHNTKKVHTHKRPRPRILGGIAPNIVGTVTTLGADTVTISLASGELETFWTGDFTAYYRMYTHTDRAAVTAGEEVAIEKGISQNGFFRARLVDVIEPYAIGTVETSTSGELVLRNVTGLERDVLVSPSTVIYEDHTTVSSVLPGETVFAWGSVASDPTQLDASAVVVIGPRLRGIVQSVSGNTIVVSTRLGTETIETSPSTIFRNWRGVGKIRPGDSLLAIGAPVSSTTLDATAVNFSRGATPPPAVSDVDGLVNSLGNS